MKTVNIHEAKTQLSKLIEEASKGEAFVIAKAGKPVVKVTALSAPTGAQVRRLRRSRWLVGNVVDLLGSGGGSSLDRPLHRNDPSDRARRTAQTPTCSGAP